MLLESLSPFKFFLTLNYSKNIPRLLRISLGTGHDTSSQLQNSLLLSVIHSVVTSSNKIESVELCDHPTGVETTILEPTLPLWFPGYKPNLPGSRLRGALTQGGYVILLFHGKLPLIDMRSNWNDGGSNVTSLTLGT